MSVRILTGDCRAVLATLPDESVHCVVTSPPYYRLRDYDMAGQIGLEDTSADFVAELVAVFREVRRVLRPDGTLWLNLGDSYAGSWGAQSKRTTPGELGRNSIENHPKIASRTGAIREVGLKPKDLMMIPARVALALQADGWFLRDQIIWAKPNGMPGSQEDRCTSSHEAVFLLTRSPDYWSDFDAIKTPPRESTMVRTAQDVQAQAGSHRRAGGTEPDRPMRAAGGLAEPSGGRRDKQRGHSRRHDGFNARWDAMSRSEQQGRPAMMRNVWFIPPASFGEAHFAVMPDELARRCILAGCPESGTVLDPFGGAGTTGLVADRLGRDAMLIELNPSYAEIIERRLRHDAGLFASAVLEAAE